MYLLGSNKVIDVSESHRRNIFSLNQISKCINLGPHVPA